MTRVLVVADEPWVRNEVHAALSARDYELVFHDEPSSAASAVGEHGIDIVVVDMQVKSMGAMAVVRDVQAASDLGESPNLHTPVVMMLDRVADVFLARRAGAAAWVQKPFTARQLREALHLALSPDGT